MANAGARGWKVDITPFIGNWVRRRPMENAVCFTYMRKGDMALRELSKEAWDKIKDKYDNTVDPDEPGMVAGSDEFIDELAARDADLIAKQAAKVAALEAAKDKA
jgi:hypothetical protein